MSDCAKCLKNGHRCSAIDIDYACSAIDIDYAPGDEPLCAFCEDNVPCPVMKRQVDPAMKERPAHKPMLQGDVLRGVQVTVHSARPLSAQAQEDVAAVAVAAVKQSRKRKELVMQTETCKCGKPLRHRGRCKGCKNAGGQMAKQSKAKQPKLQRTTATSAVDDNSDRTVATLMVSEKQLDEMFLNWPLEDKVSCIQEFLDRMEA
jgi:hypothetical protein